VRLIGDRASGVTVWTETAAHPGDAGVSALRIGGLLRLLNFRSELEVWRALAVVNGAQLRPITRQARPSHQRTPRRSTHRRDRNSHYALSRVESLAMSAGQAAGLLVLLGVVGVLAAIVGSGIEAGPVKFPSIPGSRQKPLALASALVIVGGAAWWAVQQQSGTTSQPPPSSPVLTGPVATGKLRVVLIPANSNIRIGNSVLALAVVLPRHRTLRRPRDRIRPKNSCRPTALQRVLVGESDRTPRPSADRRRDDRIVALALARPVTVRSTKRSLRQRRRALGGGRSRRSRRPWRHFGGGLGWGGCACSVRR
jgi:hypothetical protein